MAKPHRPTQVDVARLAGTSRQTVSLVALDDPRVSPATRDRVLAAMHELDYRPNIAARALAARNSRFIGIVLTDITNPFYADLCDELRNRCEALNLVPLIAVSGHDRDTCLMSAERFLHMGMEGLALVSPPLGTADLHRIGTQVPTVLLTHNTGPEQVDLVHCDDEAGARMTTRHLRSQGYAPVVYLGFDRAVPGDSAAARLRGFAQEMQHQDREPLSVDLLSTSVEDALTDVLDAFGPGAGFCCHNDAIALEAMGVLAGRGLQAGADYGITGFDDSRIASHPAVSLTSIDPRTTELAEAAMGLLSERIGGRADQAEEVFAPRLVPRGSTRPRTG
ncbi:LacI family DNA-binding transcriptional regulator [Propionibacterium australiense]|uniref:LacI family DNA-binding transcriptional regulator n=1 Tax=Propionibacterium australiense TaxID=119981 RepID=A0A383S2U5_9ACTN|nr:LacI family DNA-binding transcriptional regulator [Propionibacterium australiense]RLP11484.1 LacI family DNA-binding transcriptional regulator [Propionibacterium australiense]RLP12780.1 LacI family DNA-binding transcriptional regulator [Propionibacterium australiense]SYZ32183.1 LacI-type HTH domain [Propionibacterium australiense]VEH90729.1 Degradation activator [Propionibacterium australiense]